MVFAKGKSMSNRNVYLKMKSLHEARDILFKSFSSLRKVEKEILPVHNSIGRVLAEPALARVSSPNYNAAAMDGVALKSDITLGASEATPKELIVNKQAFYINTGQIMPEHTDSVIMIEHVNIIDEDRIQIEAPVFPWQNVRKIGEDIVATEMLFSSNHLITPYCLGALISGGVFSLALKKRPKLAIIPTGSEVVDWQNESTGDLKEGQVWESNSSVIGKLTESVGGEYERRPIIKDDIDKILAAVQEAANDDFDIIILLGGSSAGSEDYSKIVISQLGEVLVHGVTIMPGKPIIIGKIMGKPIFGIPGYPVSAIIAFEQFVGPLILKILGQPERKREKIEVIPTRKISSKLGIEEFLRVKLGLVGKNIVASPLPRGSGIITSITEADGIIRIPANIEGLKADRLVEAELLRPINTVKNTIVVVGSHDNTIDLLSDQIRNKDNKLTLSSSHVGSMGGLGAVKNGVCHLAGTHLLDTKDGSYNISYIKKFIPHIKTKLINLVLRDQGLIIPKGNPKKIKGIEDLSRKDITFINRQSGSGTRILLDYKLESLKIDPGYVRGYNNEEFTHMAVAVNVLKGSVDAGLGIYAAAKALDLDFLPLVTEQYDLVIPEEYFYTRNIGIVLEVINSKEFKSRVEALGGYSTEKTGQIIYEK